MNFSNAVPIYHALDLPENVELVWDTPTGLNRRMARGDLELSLVSSAYYLQHQADLQLLDGLSISSDGPVESVLLVSPDASLIQALQFGKVPAPPLPERVYVTEQSETSIALLRILWEARNRTLPCFEVYRPGQLETLLHQGNTVLVIGDTALSLKQAIDKGTQSLFSWDLASAWYDLIGLPMVFAVWVARQAWADRYPEQCEEIHQALLKSRDRFFADPAVFEQGVQATLKQATIRGNPPFNRELLTRYWTDCLCYSFTPSHRQALQRLGELLPVSVTAPPLPSLKV